MIFDEKMQNFDFWTPKSHFDSVLDHVLEALLKIGPSDT